MQLLVVVVVGVLPAHTDKLGSSFFRSESRPHAGSSDATDADAPARGLLPRSLEFVFARIAEREAASDGALTFTLRATFVEIYNERIYDLLAATGGDGKDKEGASLQVGPSMERRSACDRREPSLDRPCRCLSLTFP